MLATKVSSINGTISEVQFKTTERIKDERQKAKEEAFRIITINVPVKNLKAIEKFIMLGSFESRSEFARVAFQDKIDNLIQFQDKLEALEKMELPENKVKVGDKIFTLVKKK